MYFFFFFLFNNIIIIIYFCDPIEWYILLLIQIFGKLAYRLPIKMDTQENYKLSRHKPIPIFYLFIYLFIYLFTLLFSFLFFFSVFFFLLFLFLVRHILLTGETFNVCKKKRKYPMNRKKWKRKKYIVTSNIVHHIFNQTNSHSHAVIQSKIRSVSRFKITSF